MEGTKAQGAAKIIGVNIVLSGDNAVVIAMAARKLPDGQRQKAVFWGSAAAIVMRIVLTLTTANTAAVFGESCQFPVVRQ